MTENIKDEEEERLYAVVRERLEKEMGKMAWGSLAGSNGVRAAFSAGDAKAEVESIYQAIREEKLTPYQEKRLRELRLGPMFERMAHDLIGNT